MTSHELKKKKGRKKKKKEATCPVQSAKNPNATTLYEVSHFHYIWAYVIHYGPGFVT
jgi:uncharacterized surface protein with fasciclin (FAS1) repeats